MIVEWKLPEKDKQIIIAFHRFKILMTNTEYTASIH